jgi:polyvinyl alcohol dehydrogenase (cytochrome)
MMRRLVVLLSAVALLGVVPVVALASDTSACDRTPRAGGEWSTYGGDLANSRSQDEGTGIGPADAPLLAPSFVYEAPGTINNTPIVDGGCIFVLASDGSTAGALVALDADTGTEVWETRVPTGTASFGGPAVGSPAVFEDLVIAPFNKNAAPFVAAFDRHTGVQRWRATLDDQHSSGTNASLVVHEGIVFAGFFGAAGPGDPERGGFVLLDAATGTVLEKTFVIPDADFAEGFGGAGIWATPAIDAETGYAYVGTSNPHSPQKIHPRSTSIVKIDLDRNRDTFGDIVGFYQGLRDTLVPGAEQQPACDTAPDVYYVEPFSLTCLAIDVDFGSSPNLIRTPDGRTLVGNLQKAGIYHLVDAADMTGVAMVPAGPPCFACNAASTAYANGRAFVPAGPPGELVAVDVATGAPAWVGHLTGATTYNAVSAAHGMVWTVDSAGFLNGFEQQTGAQLVKRPMQLDTGRSMFAATSSSGIAVAHDALYVAATRHVIAYRTT